MKLQQLSLDELHELQVSVEDEIALRRDAERNMLLEEIAALAKVRGFLLQELLQPLIDMAGIRLSCPTKRARKAPIKFRHPDHPELVWSGRGKTPQWVKTWTEDGGSTDALTSVKALKIPQDL